MITGFAARRRAEEFNSLVESSSSDELLSARYADSLELIGALRSTTPAAPRPEFVADLRRQLMVEAATVLTPTAARLTITPRRNPRERRIALAIGGFAVVSATTSMAMAAQTALPGDTLYPLKRALENASTTIQIDEDDKGSTLLEHASGRLDEVNELTRQRDDANPEIVADTLHAFADQATSASNLMIAAYADNGKQSDIEELRSFTAQSMAVLNNLETLVPDPARAALIEAAQVITQIDTEAIRLCPTCGSGVAEVPEFAAASASGVEAILADLGSALTASAAVPDGETAIITGQTGVGAAHEGKGPRHGQNAGEPDPVIDLPSDGADGNTTNGGNGPGGKDHGVIRDITDQLTGGGSAPDQDQASVAEILGSAVDNLTGGLLGN
jgi:hypothetical protein